MNKKTRALSQEEYENLIDVIVSGFTYTDASGTPRKFRSNIRLATILQTEATTGIRISDVLELHLSDIIRDGSRYRLDIIEKKTKKPRCFTVPQDVYVMLLEYSQAHGIAAHDLIFNIHGHALTERSVQKQLSIASVYLGMEGISTHSFRKLFATHVYVNSDYNVELVRQLLQHSNVATTQRYIGIGSKQMEDALQDVSDCLLIHNR